MIHTGESSPDVGSSETASAAVPSRSSDGHVFVAALALLLDRALEKQLRAAGSDLSSPAAWQALES